MSSASYYLFRNMDGLLHLAADIVYCVLVYLQMAYVKRMGLVRHLAWLWPAAIAAAITLGYRLLILYHELARVRFSYAGYAALMAWIDLANVVGAAGSIIFVRMMLRGEIFGRPSTPRVVDPESWPPPPSPSAREVNSQ